jgi:hypothetical protein
VNKHQEFLAQAEEIVRKRAENGVYEGYAALAARDGRARVIAGGADAPVHPLGPPTVSGNNVTVDMMLNNPTRVTRMIMDLTLQRFIADRVFASAGGVTGGAVIYDEATTNELYANRDVQRVEPGAEVPVITSERLAPKVAEVEKWGGKVWTPDEARDRNQTATFTNKMRQLGNTIVRKIDQRCIEVLEASITASGQTMTGVDWSAVVTGGSSQSNASLWPARDFVTAQVLADQDELGVNYDLWLLNPVNYSELAIVYGEGLNSLISRLGVSIYVSNRVTLGSAYVVASQQVGELRVEKPLSSESWREPGRERTWTQATVRPVMYVTNPYAVLKVTGL